MKFINLIICLFCLSLMVMAQTNIDNVADELDSLSSYSFNNWKISPNLTNENAVKGDPTGGDYDDSSWGTIKLDEKNYNDSCWLRKTIVLPEKILGKPVSGKILLSVSVDDYGYIYINGVNKGYFPWDGDFTLTENAKPGDKFQIAIKAINTGGPLRLIRASIEMDGIKELSQSIKDFALSLKVGQKLLSFDTYQTNSRVKVDPGTDKSTIDKNEKKKLNDLLQKLAAEVDVDALKNNDIQKFQNSLKDVKSKLEPLKKFAKRFTLFFDSNAHIDAAWLWRRKETIQVCKNTFNSVFNIMQARPDFTYTQSAAQYYKWMEDLYPEVFKEIKTELNNGRWEIAGGMWIEPDCNLIDGESWMRQLLYAKNYFKKNFGVDVKIGWNPDSFGYNWNMPMFYKNAGIDAFITQKIGWNDTNVFPYRVFWWESPDGSKILSYFPFDYVNTITQAYGLVDWLRQFEANTGFKNMLVLFGVGDHGGGPSIDMIDRIEHLKKLDIYPTIKYGTAEEYLNWLQSQDLKDIPTWDDELYLEYHRGTYTTQAAMKKNNRESEVLLLNSEKLSSLAEIYGGRKYNRDDLKTAWEKVMFNQFHDLLPGSGIREIYIDAAEDYKEVKEIGNYLDRQSYSALAKEINTSKIEVGKPLVVFNPMAWERNDIASFTLPEGEKEGYAIFDTNGKEVPSQIIPVDQLNNKIIFSAENIPSLGYKVFELRKQESNLPRMTKDFASNIIENKFYKITIDTSNGWINSIFDKINNKEILSGSGNELQLLEDKPTAWDAWNIGWTGTQYPLKLKDIKITESGPVRTVITINHTYLKPGTVKDFPTPNFPSSFFKQNIILYSGLERIDFETDVDWWEEKTMLKVSFPLTLKDTSATFEIPYGTVQRSTQRKTKWQKARFEVPAIRWADISKNNYGVSLINNTKYGYDVKDNVMRLSLLRSPNWPDPTADKGEHQIHYSLYPHKGNWKEAKTVNQGYNFNYPLLTFAAEKHKGEFPEEYSFVKMNSKNLILTTIKKAENSDAYIFQWYEADGKDTDAEITLTKRPVKVFKSNFMEDEIEGVKPEGNKIKIKTPKNSTVTLKIYFN